MSETFHWPEKALQLAERLPLSSLHPGVTRWLDGRSWGPVTGVACSGGADSLCLLLLLWAHYPDRRKGLLALHFDHRLRGEESREDAAFVKEVAEGLGIGIRLGAWERAGADPVSEDSARRARFDFLLRELGEEGNFLFLGHQRDDIVESQLMRLSRGSGTAGLAAPRPVQIFNENRVRLRPLLTLEGRTIRCLLDELRIPYRQDASNERPGFYRNRIRLTLLPAWQEQSPFDVSAGAAASRELLEEDDDALRTWLRELMPAPLAGKPLDLRPLTGKPRALVRRALREWTLVEQVDGNLSKRAFERLLDFALAKEPCRVSAGPGVFLESDGSGLWRKAFPKTLPAAFFEDPWPLPLHGMLFLPGGKSLQARVFALDSATRACILSGRVESQTTAYADWRGGRLSVRHWQPGDRFRPLGAPGTRKLQDIFVDRKIPEAERYSLPVVLLDSQILWTPHLPPAESARINDGTKSVVRLTYTCGKAV